MKSLIATMIFCIVTTQAFAAKLTVVKNGKALVDLEGDTVKVGEQFVAMDEAGKKKALVTVKQVKGNRAVVVVEKGKAAEGYVLEPYQTRGRHSAKDGRGAAGVTFGYAMNSMTVKPASGSVNMTGSSFNLMGFYQMQLDGNISAKFAGGYQTLSAKGTADSAICNGSTDCSADLSYLGVEALVRYSFVKNKSMDFWGGGGLGFLFAVGKSSNILDTSKISTNQTIIGALGVDYSLSRDNFVPVQFEYVIYPNNSTSSATQMVFSAGYGWSF